MLNVLWIFINVLCVALTMYHLYKLYKDLSRSNLEAVRVATLVTTMISVQSPDHRSHPNGHAPTESARIKSYIAKLEREGIARVKMFFVITIAYLIFWGPLFLDTLISYTDYKTEDPSTSHEVTLHVAFVHAFVNPTLFLVLHKGLRKATFDILRCKFRSSKPRPPTAAEAGSMAPGAAEVTGVVPVTGATHTRNNGDLHADGHAVVVGHYPISDGMCGGIPFHPSQRSFM